MKTLPIELQVKMRIAVIYDIHGNLPALEEVLAEVKRLGCDRIVVGGDVFPGPLAIESLRRLQDIQLPIEFIRGNGESAIVAFAATRSLEGIPLPARDSIKWHVEQLTESEIATLATWSPTFQLNVPDVGRVFFCHATPRNDTEIFTERTREAVLEPIFRATGADVVICGHTHMQFDRIIGGVRVINAGSVGMPFGHSSADWLLIDTHVRLMRTAYDREDAAVALVDSGFPGIESFVERTLRNPAPASAMLDAYAKVELTM